MKLAVRKTSAAVAAVAAVATAGVSTLFLGATPAYAAPNEACGPSGALIAPGVCEAVFTSGTSTFTPAPHMTKLEVLLVGAGGNGVNQNATATTGYAAGGGGEVRLVDFSGATSDLTLTVATPGGTTSAGDGTTTETAASGATGVVDDAAVATGGASGNGNAGASVPAGDQPSYGGGGGAGGAASGADGGAGVVVDSLAASGSLFDGDTRCYGGGGAVSVDGVLGVPGCGGGSVTADGSMISPTENSGGGSGARTLTSSAGASGVVILRYTAANITLSFDVDGRGEAPFDQSVLAGTTAVRPADPTAEGYLFAGWYTDEELTIEADFDTPLTESVTYYAKWTRVLPATGGAPDAAALPIGLGALIAGAALALVARKRREV